MTTRTTTRLAVGAIAFAGCALLARPLLSGHDSPATAATPTTPPRGVAHIAVEQARDRLACDSTTTHEVEARNVCGNLRIVRREVDCPSPTRCVANLIGELHTPSLTAPIALTVTMIRVGAIWWVVEISS
ncbi:MAG TPA: hypothetical protein VHC43_18205 [Mycobacteriales bacterium]|nr:hypothetical protein [Mycobacteriales bacterium]